MAISAKTPAVVLSTYDKALHYVELIFQRGRDVGDWELNELQKILRVNTVESLSAAERSGVRAKPDGGALLTPTGNPNEILVKQGWFHIDGQAYYLETDTVVALPAPDAFFNRIDFLYFTVAEASYRDTALEHPSINETTLRRRMDLSISVSSAALPATGAGMSYEGNTRSYVFGAVFRPVGVPIVAIGQCFDLTRRQRAEDLHQRLNMTGLCDLLGGVYWDGTTVSFNGLAANITRTAIGLPSSEKRYVLDTTASKILADYEGVFWDSYERWGQVAGDSLSAQALTVGDIRTTSPFTDGTNQELDIWPHFKVYQAANTYFKIGDTPAYRPRLHTEGHGWHKKAAKDGTFTGAETELEIWDANTANLRPGVYSYSGSLVSVPADVNIPRASLNNAATLAYTDSTGDNFIWINVQDPTATGIVVQNVFADIDTWPNGYVYVGYIHLANNDLTHASSYVRNVVKNLTDGQPVLTVNGDTAWKHKEHGEFNDIQSAINYGAYLLKAAVNTELSGVTLRLLPGVYHISEPLRVHGIDDLEILGSRKGTVIEQTGAAAVTFMYGSAAPGCTVSFESVQFKAKALATAPMFYLNDFDEANVVATSFNFKDCDFYIDAASGPDTVIFNVDNTNYGGKLKCLDCRFEFNNRGTIVGGVNMSFTGLHFERCVFVNFVADTGQAFFELCSGAAPIPYAQDITIKGCDFFCKFEYNNLAPHGYVIFAQQIRNFRFEDNDYTAEIGTVTGPAVPIYIFRNGGGVLLARSEKIVIRNNHFRFVSGHAPATAADHAYCVVINSTVGAVPADPDASPLSTRDVVIENNTVVVQDNDSLIGICSLTEVTRAKISGNTIEKEDNDAASIRVGHAAIYLEQVNHADVVNNKSRGIESHFFRCNTLRYCNVTGNHVYGNPQTITALHNSTAFEVLGSSSGLNISENEVHQLGAPALAAFNIYGGTHAAIKIDRNTIRLLSCWGISLAAATDFSINGNMIRDCNERGIYVYGTGPDPVSGGTIANNTLKNILKPAAVDCWAISLSSAVGALTPAVTDVNISGNVIKTVQGDAIIVRGVKAVRIDGNNVYNCIDSGIYVGSNSIVYRDPVRANNTDGVLVAWSKHVCVCNNYVRVYNTGNQVWRCGIFVMFASFGDLNGNYAADGPVSTGSSRADMSVYGDGVTAYGWADFWNIQKNLVSRNDGANDGAIYAEDLQVAWYYRNAPAGLWGGTDNIYNHHSLGFKSNLRKYAA